MGTIRSRLAGKDPDCTNLYLNPYFASLGKKAKITLREFY